MHLVIDKRPELRSLERTGPSDHLSQSPVSAGAAGLARGRTSNHRGDSTRLISRFALLVSVAATSVVVAMDRQLPNQWHVAAVAVACAAYVVMLAADRRSGGLTIGFVVGATLVPVVAALSVMPRNGDLWSYATYGRMLGIHHVSPWTHAPAAFPHDPFGALVGRTWVNTPSVYGPVFTALSAAGALLFGGAMLYTRLFYQGLAAVALGGGALLVWRHTRLASAVAFLVVHPLVVIYLVNPGRNDIFVGVAMLAAVFLAARNRPGAAGAVGALGAMVKLTGVVGVVALLVTTAVRGSRQATRRMGLAAAGVFAVGYVAAGKTALLAPMQTAGGMYSRGSPWSLLSSLGATQPSPQVALAFLAILVLVVVARHARSSDSTAVAASSGMLALAASYTLPGYAAWGLPVAALDHRSQVSRIVSATGVVLLITYEVLRHPFAGPIGSVLNTMAATGGPLLMIVLVIALLRTRTYRTKETSAMTLTMQTEPRVVPGVLQMLVVVPTLNEAANIRTVLVRIRASLPGADVLVVDDGSNDDTPELADAVANELGQVTVLRRTGPRGLGPAYRAGFAVGLSQGYDVIVQMDADLSHDPSDLPELVAVVQQGAGLVIGSRYVPGGETPGWPARRRFLSRAGGWYARSMLRIPARDVTSGYRAYRADVLRAVDVDAMETTGFGFQIDSVDRARRAGAVIREVPIVFRDRTAGESKMSGDIVREALLMVTKRALHRWFRRPSRHQDAGAMKRLNERSSSQPVLTYPSAEVAS